MSNNEKEEANRVGDSEGRHQKKLEPEVKREIARDNVAMYNGYIERFNKS